MFDFSSNSQRACSARAFLFLRESAVPDRRWVRRVRPLMANRELSRQGSQHSPYVLAKNSTKDLSPSLSFSLLLCACVCRKGFTFHVRYPVEPWQGVPSEPRARESPQGLVGSGAFRVLFEIFLARRDSLLSFSLWALKGSVRRKGNTFSFGGSEWKEKIIRKNKDQILWEDFVVKNNIKKKFQVAVEPNQVS